MTPESRILESISAMRSQSAWSPMPEHLLFLQKADDKSQTPATPETPAGGVNICKECGLKFKTDAMLTYHRVGFCVGKSTEEPPPTPFQLSDEETIMLNEGKKSDRKLAKDGTATQASNTKRQSKLEWRMGAEGAVPPSAVKVGYDDHDQTHTYVCLAQVGEEVIPGSVLPSRKHATVALNGEEFKATEYSVLTDLDGQVSWKRCDVVGGIPRGAVKGGYDSKNLQYFIARGKAPDGTFCCGQYIPHKQQCYFAWEGTEFTTKDFEFLCKKKSEQQFIKLGTRKNQVDKPAADTSKQLTSSGTELISNADTELSQDKYKKVTRPGTRAIERGSGKENNTTSRSATGIMDQDINKTTKDKTKPSVTKELTKSGTGIVTKDKNKPINTRELTKGGTAVIPSTPKSSTRVRENSKNLQF